MQLLCFDAHLCYIRQLETLLFEFSERHRQNALFRKRLRVWQNSDCMQKSKICIKKCVEFLNFLKQKYGHILPLYFLQAQLFYTFLIQYSIAQVDLADSKDFCENTIWLGSNPGPFSALASRTLKYWILLRSDL